MEMNLKQLSTQKTEATTGSVKMRLSENATSMVFQLFTKNIYSNPIGTVVREITSNCFDSHVEANVNSPVLVRKSFSTVDNCHYISFIDYGVGMSPDRVNNIYGVYFESTKRADNTQIGGFGIGGKTPLAYKRKTGHGDGEYDNSFFVITNFDGTKYVYAITEGEECPVITLLHSETTTDRNGTEVRVPILEKDLPAFEKEMIRQLYYFENVVFDGFDKDGTVTNDYKIVKGQSFLYRGENYDDEIHVCLGRVAYPINYNILGLNGYDYQLPVAIRLEVGEINVVASREQLDYNETTIKVIKKKLDEVIAEIKQMVAKQYENIVTLEQYFQVKNNFGTLYLSNGMTIDTGKLLEFKDIDLSNFKYSFLKMPNDRQLFRFFFNTKMYGKKTRKNKYNSDINFDGDYENLQKNDNLYYFEEPFVRKLVKQAYLKSQHERYHMISLRNMTAYTMCEDIADLFNVHLDKTCDANGKPVKFVRGLINMQAEFFTIVQKYAKDYNTLSVPADFVMNRKNNTAMSAETRKKNIPLKFIGGSKDNVQLGLLFDYNRPIFYGTQDDEYMLKNALKMYEVLFDSKAPVDGYSNYYKKFTNDYSDTAKNSKSIMFIMLAKNNIKYMENCKNAKPVAEFFTGLLKRKEDKVKNYFHTYDLSQEWDSVGELFRSEDFKRIDIAWGRKITTIRDFMSKITVNSSIGNMKAELGRYFDLSKQKESIEQKKIGKLIAEVKKLQKDNSDVMRYINIPYYDRSNLTDQILIDILQKVMTF
jgi:hypothetical protein